MREIKFEYIFTCDGRDGIKDERRVFTLSEIQNGAVDGFLDVEYTITARVLAIRQFTGLHDKNGKEIYEGDLYEVYYKIKNNDTGEEKEWRELKTVTWGRYEDSEYGWSTWCYLLGSSPLSAEIAKDTYSNHYWTAVEERQGVIGNIYENPELLT